VKNAPNPDFEIEVGHSKYLFEVKRADEGDRASEERVWLGFRLAGSALV
jgi:hypothetical protein